MWKAKDIISPVFFREIQCSGEIVFNHTDCHCSIICTLAFYVIDLVSNAQAGICNDGFVFCYLLIGPLDDFHIVRVRSMKDFIDQRDYKFRHFLHDGAENINERFDIF